MKSKKSYLNQAYNQDKDTGAYVVELALHRYRDVFNEWDPAPFKKRDIDPDLYEFLGECAYDIPLKYPLAMMLHISKDARDEEKEKLIIAGMRNNFSFDINSFKKRIKESTQKMLRYIATAVTFLFLAFWLEKIFKRNIFSTILLEGLFIGGWVFLWEAFSVFSFERKKIVKKLKITQRFMVAEIKFKYEG